MGQEVKIRTLPRAKETKDSSGKSKPLYLSAAALAVLLLLFVALSPKAKPKTSLATAARQPQTTQSADRINEKISRHMQDLAFQDEVRRQARELENLEMKGAGALNVGSIVLDNADQNLGVQMDQEDTAERVFQDIRPKNQPSFENLPVDRINHKLADRKWINNLERAERIQFVRNFIRSAYEKGYEVEIDQNLVVTGVRKMNPNRIMTIDQVLNNMAKQGL
jgi:hypothetical protein